MNFIVILLNEFPWSAKLTSRPHFYVEPRTMKSTSTGEFPQETSVKLEYLPEGSPDLIRLYDFGQSEAEQLRELVKLLATGDRENVALHTEPWVESVGGCFLSLRRRNRNQGHSPIADA
jgi:hypothetical protein